MILQVNEYLKIWMSLKAAPQERVNSNSNTESSHAVNPEASNQAQRPERTCVGSMSRVKPLPKMSVKVFALKEESISRPMLAAPTLPGRLPEYCGCRLQVTSAGCYARLQGKITAPAAINFRSRAAILQNFTSEAATALAAFTCKRLRVRQECP